MQLGRALREMREEAGLSRDTLSYISGVSAKQIARLESDSPPKPRPSTLRKLGDALGVGADFFCQETGMNLDQVVFWRAVLFGMRAAA